MSSGGGITNAQFTYINHGDAYSSWLAKRLQTRKTSSLHLL
ncbi:part of phage tail fiber [Escherichia coli DEC12A]|nr:part of phage tail fiber [Escherichia coli DEC12A]